MKTLSTVVLFSALLLFGCNPEKEDLKEDQKSKINFNLSLSNDNGQSRQALAIPASSYLQISIETLDGEIILENENIEILSFNGNYVSKPLELNVGEYYLTEFLVISPEDEVLYATPMTGSPMANLVCNSLPRYFEIKGDSETELELEVLNVSLLDPQDIGYVSFPFTAIDFFFLSVFELNQQGSNLTHAKGHILQDEDTIKSFSIKPNINTISFSNNENEIFNLVIIKDGFSKYSEDFTIERLFDTYENGLLNIQLEPALTFTAFREAGYDPNEKSNFEFSLNFVGEITINWGDGQIETKTPTDDFYMSIGHKFENDQKHFVSISGDVDKIADFSSYYGMGPITKITLSNLPNLEYFSNGYTGTNMSPKVLDFSKNPKIKDINVANNSELQKIILRDENEVEVLLLGDSYKISTSSLDEIINPIYNSAVANNRMNGVISLANFPDAEEPIVGPPSENAWTKLAILEKEYNWTISTVYDDGKE